MPGFGKGAGGTAGSESVAFSGINGAKVTGTFRWNDTSRPVSRSRDPHVRYVRVGGFGWMSIDDKTITDITECRPIGRNIPAGIN